MKSNFATPTPFDNISCFVVGVSLANYNLNCSKYIKRPIQKDTSDILSIGKFWEAKEGVTMSLLESEIVDHPRKREERTQTADSHNTIKLEQPI